MLVFFGTSRHSAQFLKLILEKGLKINLVVSSPSKPIGKKQILTENPIAIEAKKLNIPVVLSLSDLSETMKQYNNATIGLILDFNKIIPAETINLFSKGIINIHFSKLPRYRGASPVQYTILNGDKEAWISYYLIDENLDTGKVITQTSLLLDLTENTEILYQKLTEKASSEIKRVLENYLENKIMPKSQEGIPTFTRKLKTENCQIDWLKPPVETERLIRAAYPEPGAWTEIVLSIKKQVLRKRLKILSAHLDKEKLVLDQVQLEGKNPVTWKQFVQGHPQFSLASPEAS